MKKSIVEQVRGRPKYLHNALHFQSDCPNLIDLRAFFSQSQGPPAPGSERQENPCSGVVWQSRAQHVVSAESLYLLLHGVERLCICLQC